MVGALNGDRQGGEMMRAMEERVAALTPQQREALREKIQAVRKESAPATRLVAFVQARDGQAVDGAVLKSHLASLLPAYMLPTAVQVIEAMPLTPNGKIDRRALEGMRIAPDAHADELVAPRDAFEHTIAGIWSTLLGVDELSVHDDFFELGGHSLLVTRAIARINESFGVALPVKVFFDQPSIAGLAAYVRRQTHAVAGVDRDTLEL
jgi:acyl carrier protein